MIAFLGAGLLGSGFVRALARRGEAVRVWNRTSAKARALAGEQVTPFDDAAEAARGAARVHVILSDDAAVDAVLEAARPGLTPGVTIVDHTTTSATGAAARAARWTSGGFGFVHAPVFMGPQNALESTGIMLVCGERARVDAVSPALAKMTGKLVDLGDDPRRAASFKLLGNLFLMFLTSGVAEVFGLGKALGVAPTDAAKLFEIFNPAGMVGARAQRMIAAQFGDASWELGMARKDARLMLEESARGGVDLAVLPAIAALMDRYIAGGHAHDDWTIIGKGNLSS
ncbi:MAG TPA: NAD(P)-binding domain-containing protein [Byssovorax sp.]|jgi:3-hydroxyisobutyrate dehydrogenase